MTFLQIATGIALLVGTLVAAAWGVPQAVLLWRQVFERIRSDRERRRAAGKKVSGFKEVVRIAVILNGDLEYARNLFRGFQDEAERLLEESSYEPVFNVVKGSPREDDDAANAAALEKVVHSFDSIAPHYLVTFGTRVSQYAALHASPQLPIIFVGVTDPVESGILAQRPMRSIAGTTYGISIRERISFLLRVFPKARRIGYVFSHAYPQDLIVRDQFRNAASSLPGFPDNFPTFDATESDLDREEADGIDILIGWAYLNSKMDHYLQMGFPIAGIGIAESRQGAVASTGNDDVRLGRLAAEKLLFQSLVKGVALNDIPLIQTADDNTAPQLFAVNLTAARRHGLTVLERPELEQIARVFG